MVSLPRARALPRVALAATALAEAVALAATTLAEAVASRPALTSNQRCTAPLPAAPSKPTRTPLLPAGSVLAPDSKMASRRRRCHLKLRSSNKVAVLLAD